MSEKKKHTFAILRDFWDEDEKRHRKGTLVELPADDALDLLEGGRLERVKK